MSNPEHLKRFKDSIAANDGFKAWNVWQTKLKRGSLDEVERMLKAWFEC